MSNNMSNASSTIPQEWAALLNAYQSGQKAVLDEMREHYANKADLSGVREDMANGFAGVAKEFAAVRGEISALRESTAAEFATVRGELHEVEKRLNGEISEVKINIGKLEGGIAVLQSKVAVLQSKVDVLTDKVSEVGKSGRTWFFGSVGIFLAVSTAMNAGLVMLVNQRLPAQQPQPIAIQQPAPAVPTIPPAVVQGEKPPATE